MRRYVGLDVLRGLGIMGVVFLHSALYHFANLRSIDFDNPPLIVVVIGLLLMWAGLFAILSGTVHAVQTVRRFRMGVPARDIVRGQLVNGAAILVLAYVYFLFLGPALLDRVTWNHDHSVLQNLLISGTWAFPSLERLLYVDALVMIGINVVICALVLALVWRLDPIRNLRRASLVVGLVGSLIVLASYGRLRLYPIVERAIAVRDWPVIIGLNWLANKNNPILPFAGFGLFGTLLGVRLACAPDFRRAWRPVGAMAVVWLVSGVVAYLLLPETMLERAVDPMWYTIMVAQVGLFLLLAIAFVRFFDATSPAKAAARARGSSFVRRFGVAGLSVFIVETPVGQLVANALSALRPGWNDSMAATLVFAALLVGLWGAALALWERTDYAFSVERLLVRGMARSGKESTKLAVRVRGPHGGDPMPVRGEPAVSGGEAQPADGRKAV